MKSIAICECGGELKTVDSRPLAEGRARFRRKICPVCRKLTYTIELETALTQAQIERLTIRSQ